MKKFIAVVLALVLCMSFCAFASAATTEAMSSPVYVTVKQFEIQKGDDVTGSIAKSSTSTTAVVATVDLKDTDRDVSYTVKSSAGLDKTVPVAKNSVLNITAGEVMTGVEKSQNVTVTVTAMVTSGDGKAYAAADPVSITFKVVVAGSNLSDDEEKDSKTPTTTGDFTCSISAKETVVFVGDPIELTATANLTGDTLAVLGTDWSKGVTYKIYVMKNGETVGTITAKSSTTTYKWAVLEDSQYTFWAVATLEF